MGSDCLTQFMQFVIHRSLVRKCVCVLCEESIFHFCRYIFKVGAILRL
ncbi:hypothetical protein EVA_06144 [gut metagenome]|uniref:Uncharacterized protein n=1 Tax=gut metagenome TaxID=749906 RepID=J9GFN7_9ZZZZ